MVKVRELMETAMGRQAADLHLQTGRPPMMRLAQGLCPLPGPPLSEGDLRQVLQAVGWSGGDQGDGAFSWHDALRCRLHVCREYAGLHVTIRFLYPLASLPPDGDGPLLQRLSRLTCGLVLVCGPTGSGKTTALWRILQAINERRPCHIVTLEDPIEYVEAGKAALITQRELGTHFATFAEGIRQALRQDPDVILIGEMRDRAAMDAALTAAETGHFVLSTLHTPSAAQAVSRLAGAYSGEAQQKVRCRLAMVLQAILVQAVAYPVFLLVCLAALTAGACLFIIPVFMDMMVQMAVPLPKGTQYVLALFDGLRQYGLYGLAGLCCALIALRWAWQRDEWRLRLERQIVRFPGMASWFLIWAWQRFSQILAVQLAGGIPLLDCLSEAAAVVPSCLFRQYVWQARLLLERGCAFSQAVHAGRFGTPYVETMLAVGEMTGTYDEALASIAVYYGSRLQLLAGRIRRWLGPVVLLLTGALMGVLILCFLLPLLDMASSIVT